MTVCWESLEYRWKCLDKVLKKSLKSLEFDTWDYEQCILLVRLIRPIVLWSCRSSWKALKTLVSSDHIHVLDIIKALDGELPLYKATSTFLINLVGIPGWLLKPLLAVAQAQTMFSKGPLFLSSRFCHSCHLCCIDCCYSWS